jgi:tellurite resistance protein TerC
MSLTISPLWLLFNIGVIGLLWADLKLFHSNDFEIPVRQALKLSVFWITLSLLFNVYIAYSMGQTAALDFFTAYVVEKSLSVDNLFVFLLIFNHFQVPRKYQHKVLYYGILGALVMRGVFIFLGVALLAKYEQLIYILGAFLVFSGAKLIRAQYSKQEDENQPKLLEYFSRLSEKLKDIPGSEGRLFLREGFLLRPTKLFVVILCVEVCDVIFALDSIPAVLAISKDPFIIYSSNVCAILGLRALFFALAGLIGMFRFLDHGLAFILLFVGAKMMLKSVIEIPSWFSLMCIVSILSVSILLSIFMKEKEEENGIV